ncbi:MAG: beta-1,6-N-acetylglucosaminyltransferase [Gemmobacter sp.]
MRGRLGVIVLCHGRLTRAAALVRHFARAGARVAVHVDAAVPEDHAGPVIAALAALEGVVLVPRHACSWGGWSIVAATEAAARILLGRFPDVGHVLLCSGACLPLRPVAEIAAHFAALPDTDHIETHPLGATRWTKGGLEAERFTLRFPFAFRGQRRLFDAAVAVQRRLGLARRLPEGIAPHLGAQWWCLTRATLAGILDDPEGARLRRYFRGVWIPDEAYFQTLVHRHAREILPRSPTFARFDASGRPHVFHDDQADLLAATGALLARKIWPGAEGLYARFLGDPGPAPPADGRLEALLAAADLRRAEGRAGLAAPGRFADRSGRAPTARPYGVFCGLDAEAQRVAAGAGLVLHGHLFDPAGAAFAGGGMTGPGALPAAPFWRDYAPADFLRNLIWAGREGAQAFLLRAADAGAIGPILAHDANARGLVVLRGLPGEEALCAALRAPAARHAIALIEARAFDADPARHIGAALAALRPEPAGGGAR